MFFARTEQHGSKSDEKLCIFGDLRARRGAELKVMSAVEHKHPGYCVNSKGELREISRFKGDEDEDGWDTESMLLSEDNFSCVARRVFCFSSLVSSVPPAPANGATRRRHPLDRRRTTTRARRAARAPADLSRARRARPGTRSVRRARRAASSRPRRAASSSTSGASP
jgi:hypothetical protein